jgi:hypothetical protein
LQQAWDISLSPFSLNEGCFMFSHLNVKTRRIVRDMCAGKPTRLGGANIGVMPEGSRRLLAVLAGHVDSLSGLGGQDLITKVLELYAGFRFESAVEELNMTALVLNEDPL